MAANVPSTVDTAVAITATDRVTFSASMIFASPNRSLYQSKVKPVHTAEEREALKDRAIITTMGAYRKNRISIRYVHFSAFFTTGHLLGYPGPPCAAGPRKR